jgi:hypothetical protein
MMAAHLLKLELKRFLPWHQARIDCLAQLIVAMVQVRTVNLTQLALAFDAVVQQESVYQRVKRFFRHPAFEADLVAVLVTSWLALDDRWVLCLDRTLWQLGGTPINVLVLSVAYGGVSVPLMWTVLGKKGNSSTEERIALMERFLYRFPPERIECLTADREFRGHRWLAYLIQRQIRFRLRLPNNTKTHNRHRNARLPVTRLFPVQSGEVMVLNRPRRLWGHTLYLVGTRAPSGEHVIVMTTHTPEHALEDYRQRWQTECLFAVMKHQGFNLEDTHITDPERVARLIGVMTLALCWCYKVGVWLDQQRPIGVKKHQRRALLNGASQTRQIRHWIYLRFDKKIAITKS